MERMIHITPKETAILQFSYDAELVVAVKEIPGRRWHADKKIWYIPHPDPFVLETFADCYNFSMTPEAIKWIGTRQRKMRTAKGYLVDESAEEIEIPKVVLEPWNHQKRAYAYMAASPAMLFAGGMGIGKSRVVIDYIVNNPVHYTLIVCPSSVVSVWEEQIQKHAAEPLQYVPLFSGVEIAKRVKQLNAVLDTYNPMYDPKLVVVINKEAAWREPLSDVFLKQQWDLVVADEGHYLRGAGTKISRYMARLREKSHKRVLLSGTPMCQGPIDIYAEYRFLDPSIFGTSKQRFIDKYCDVRLFGFGQQIVGYKNTEEFTEKFNRVRFHVSRDVLDLPEAVNSNIIVDIPPAARKLHNALDRELIGEVEGGMVSAANVLVKLIRMSQITSGFVPVDGIEIEDPPHMEDLHKAKREALREFLEGLPQDEPVVVFCRFTMDLVAVSEIAADLDRSYAEVSGTSKQLAAWQNGEFDILGVQLAAGAEGINLTRARYAVFYSPVYSLAQWEQAHARLHRPGARDTVFFYYLLARDTVDVKILNILTSRRDVIDAIINQEEG